MGAAILKLPTPLSEVAEVLARIHDAGVHIRVEKGRIVAGPRSAITEELTALIRSYKDAIIAVVPEDEVTHVTDVTDIGEHRGDVGYTKEDLAEMDSLIQQLAEIEHWSPEELAEAMDGRRRMAPARVQEVLQQLRYWVDSGIGRTPERPAKRSRIVFCRLSVIQGGKR